VTFRNDRFSSSNDKVQEDAQGNHIAFLGKKYSIQRDHIVAVVQLELEVEVGPESASVQEPELELVPSQGQGQGQELAPAQE
jgi:hypothetical protein